MGCYMQIEMEILRYIHCDIRDLVQNQEVR